MGNAYPKGKPEHKQVACPSFAARLPFLAARRSKEVIIKHLFAKSQPINPIATTPSLASLVPWSGGMKERRRSNKQAGAWQQLSFPKLFVKRSSP